MKTFSLMLTEKQAAVLRDACELLARVHMGQFDAVANEVAMHGPGWNSSIHDAHGIALKLEQCLFPTGAGPRPERANIAWDLYQVVRHCVAWETLPPNEDRPEYLVQYGRPMLTSAEPLAKCEVVDRGDENAT